MNDSISDFIKEIAEDTWLIFSIILGVGIASLFGFSYWVGVLVLILMFIA